MIDLLQYQAKICLVAVGSLVVDDKMLLIKHKKLSRWFCPGGHVDKNELPHLAAEREFWEETGVRVKAIDYGFSYNSKASTYVPSPIFSNLHWMWKENYLARTQDDAPPPKGRKACEQHLGLVYLVEALDGLDFKQNVEETDGIGWFSLEEINKLEANQDFRREARYTFELAKKLKG